MPKVKITRNSKVLKGLSWWVIGASMTMSVANAQMPSVMDVINVAKESKAQESSKSLLGLTAKSGGASVQPGTILPAAPVTVVDPPVLRAIYGVNQLIEAELVFGGQSYSLYSDSKRVAIGPWTYGVVFHEGVLLTKKPLNSKQSSQIHAMSEQGLERLISCKELGLSNNSCLFLAASKGSVGTSLSVRASSSAPTGILPPLPR